MAKRYGRNQRRRHRAQIEALSSSVMEQRGLITNAEIALTLMRKTVAEWDIDIRKLLGAYSAFRFKTERMKSDSPFIRVSIADPFDHLSPIAHDITMIAARVSVVELRRMVVASDRNRWDLSQVIRLIVERSNGREELHFAYQIDGKTLFTLGTRDLPVLSGFIAKELFTAANEARHG